MTTTEVLDLLPAERRLFAAALAGDSCDLIDPEAVPTHDEIVEWDDPDRIIRAEILARLIANRLEDHHVDNVSVRGAIIVGELDVEGESDLVAIDFLSCRFDELSCRGATFAGDVRFCGTTFTEDPRFDEVTFAGGARFDGARFAGGALFGSAVFTGGARFDMASFAGDAWFDGARFTENALFVGATFTGSARFDGVTFTGEARFGRVTFTSDALFVGATFTEVASFVGATITRDARFERATFTGDAWFGGATFRGDAVFDGATFTKDARFDRVTFAGDTTSFGGVTFDLAWVDFDKVAAQAVSFRRARFSGTFDGHWAANAVSFEEARFAEPVTVRLSCQSLSLVNVELRSGGTLQIRGDIDATAAAFGDRTTLSDPGEPDWAEWLLGSSKGRVRALEPEVRVAFVRSLVPIVGASASVRSLRRATVADLELSAVDLTDCLFAGAHGLDKMRIDSACILPATPADTGFRRPIRFTRRTVIAEERMWRERHATWATGSVDPTNPPETDDDPPSAPIVAGIYRSLRKGLEDARNEPGAADFYYGEMEMRRLARRAPSPAGPKPSLAEKWLLTGYWALAGYGLRAWRALAAIAALILVGSVVFATVGVQDPPGSTSQLSQVDLATGTVEYTQVPRPAFTWPDAVELAARSSVALLRNPSGAPALTAIGTVVDIALRLLVPLLLALAVLAIRGRTKR